ncbi:hypothetical protein E3N88_14498 [Mikania micrantha]|uniref:NADH:ubiquinone oxidoreductase 30kDa subunit domain-containing protein n=1 Tax=Mikania micrantha TaxID=192012 RepID=A0A5N6P2V6_9ASTR|nr:hypothetical protein E3N88_14498 [Mikania micrantha]
MIGEPADPFATPLEILPEWHAVRAPGSSHCLGAYGFMFYFTPRWGFFSPFPHGTTSLSVTQEYLALQGCSILLLRLAARRLYCSPTTPFSRFRLLPFRYANMEQENSMKRWWFNSMLFKKDFEHRCRLSKSTSSLGPIENASERDWHSIAVILYVYGYNYLRSQCAYDVAPGGLLASVYHLTRIEYGVDQPEDVCIKVFAPRRDPRILSVFWVWKSVDFQERESYDMLGISYDNHPRLKRILMPESWIGWPLRKDYIAPNFYEIQDAH